MTVDVLGYTGALLLAICALPQMVMTLKDGHARGVSALFLTSWYLGEILMLIFLIDTTGYGGPLFWNYIANVVMLSVIVKYKIWERKIKLTNVRKLNE